MAAKLAPISTYSTGNSIMVIEKIIIGQVSISIQGWHGNPHKPKIFAIDMPISEVNALVFALRSVAHNVAELHLSKISAEEVA